jgi:aminoacyl-tRNA hydrolase
MSPVVCRDGVTFIRDDQKASFWTISASLDFMRSATAKRKIVVIGTISDFPGNPARKYPRVARQALDAAHHVFFVGRNASKCLPARRSPDDPTLRAFVSVDHLISFLRDFLQQGDLILLKGSERADDLPKVVEAWNNNTSKLPSVVTNCQIKDGQVGGGSDQRPLTKDKIVDGVHVVVGLGNLSRKFQGTFHNVGQDAIDALAVALQAQWNEDEFGMLAHGTFSGHSILMVKLASLMNDTGPNLLRMSRQWGFGAENCVLLHDDINLDPGTVRIRMNGSSGGHNGVQSVVEAFQSEAIRRVKIGVGRPPNGSSIAGYLLSPIPASQYATIEKACQVAARQSLHIICTEKKPSPAQSQRLA